MGLLDWLTDGLGSSMGQGETGMGAGGMAALTPPTPQPDAPMQPVTPTPPVAPTPAVDASGPFAQGTDPMTAGGTPPNGPGLPAPTPAPSPATGPAAIPPAAAPTGGTGMPPGPPTSLAPTAPGPTTPWKLGDQTALGRALGIDPNDPKTNSFRSAMAGLGEGLTAAGNSKGKSAGQAFGAGAGGALTGATKQDNTQYDQRLKSLQLAVDAQAKGDTAAYNKNMVEYHMKSLENDKSTAKKSGAWNKPDTQKFIDAQNALAKDPEIHASQKMLEKLATTGTQAEIAQATAQHNALIQQKQQMYLTGVGLDPAKIQANIQNPPGTPQNPHVVTSKADFDTYVKPGQAYKNPADGKIYIRKGAANAGSDEAAPETPGTTAPAPPGPAPGTSSKATDEDDD